MASPGHNAIHGADSRNCWAVLSMVPQLGADYVRTARAKGLAEPAVVGWHAFRNTLIHVLTVVGSVAVVLLGGAFVVETVFNLPGLGNLVVMAVKRRDYPLVQGVVLISASAYVLINFLVDVSYSLLNPRIRVAGSGES